MLVAVSTLPVVPCARTRPARSRISSVHSVAARFRSWVETTIVVPRSRFNCFRSVAISNWKPTSSAVVGSSSRRMSDACASALAMTTRCFSPPLRVANRRDSSPAVPVAASACRAIAKSSGPSSAKAPRCAYRPMRTISIALKSKVTCVSCGTTATRRASSRRDNADSGMPSRTMLPVVGLRVPDNRRISVVLPEPFGPMRPTIDPRAADSETPSSTRAAPGYSKARSTASRSIGDLHVERPATRSLDRARSTEQERTREERRLRHDGVVLAALAAFVDPEPDELRTHTRCEGTTEPRAVEILRTCRDDQRFGAGRDPLIEQHVSRLAPERLHSREPAPLAHPLRPPTMLVEHDVAEHDVRDASGGHAIEYARERLVVGVPGAAANDLRDAKAIGLRRDNLGTKAVGAAPCRILIEHGDHGHDVELLVDTVQRRAAVFSAAPGDRGPRFGLGHC